jgi:hypothetical protein
MVSSARQMRYFTSTLLGAYTNRQLAVVAQHGIIAETGSDKFLLFLAVRAGHHGGDRAAHLSKT